MVELATYLRLLAGAVLLLSNGYFVTIEFAMTRVRQFAEEEFVGQGRGLERAWEMTERLEIFLSGCQLGITISSVGLGFAAEPALAAVLDPAVRAAGIGGLLGGGGASGAGHTALSIALALAVINLLHLIVGEQAPTYLGIERTKLVARYGAPILYWWTRLFSPVIRLADWAAKALLSAFGVSITRSWTEEEIDEEGEAGRRPGSRGELRSRMGEVLRGGELSAERQQEVFNALAIDELPVREMMVEREGIVALHADDDLDANLALVGERPHTRFPLVGDEPEEFLGVVYSPALFDRLDAIREGGLDLREVATPPMSVPAAIAVSELIDRFQVERKELALVTERADTAGSDGAAEESTPSREPSEAAERAAADAGDVIGDDERVVGLVTATDAFETIAGELEDPLD
jgi:CBS domain containing-hemolysin-like protein